jgi:hypothetical protein
LIRHGHRLYYSEANGGHGDRKVTRSAVRALGAAHAPRPLQTGDLARVCRCAAGCVARRDCGTHGGAAPAPVLPNPTAAPAQTGTIASEQGFHFMAKFCYDYTARPPENRA